MRRVIAAAVIVSTVSGCITGSRKTRFIASGITVGVGGAIAIAPFALAPYMDQPPKNDGGLQTGAVVFIAGCIIAGLGMLGVFATAGNIPPSPSEWNEHEPGLVRQADVAARTGHCETSNAIARRVYAEHEDDYRRDFLTNAAIVACMQAGRAEPRK